MLFQLAAKLVVAEAKKIRSHALIKARLVQCSQQQVLFRIDQALRQVSCQQRVAALRSSGPRSFRRTRQLELFIDFV